MTIKYTEDHEWVAVEGDVATIGITDFAQQSLGDIVFVELPEPGSDISERQEIVVIESVKAAGEIKAPVAGVILEVNERLIESPELINEDPMGEAWFIRVRLKNANLNILLNKEEYTKLVGAS